MSILSKSNNKASARRQINIKGVRDGVLILPGHQYRVVLSLSSINFELKSEAEQDALIDTYQSFLNSLASPMQIIIRIREMDMDKYLNDFNARMRNESQEIYRTQVKNYTDFVKSLITSNKILTRHFYVVVPYNSKEKDFEVIKEQLALSADIVAKGLARMGIQSRLLSSLEILDLFYNFYSPAQAKRQPLRDQTMQLLTESYL